MQVFHILHRADSGPGASEAELTPVPERFSWAAFLFGPLWFLWQGCWPLALGVAVPWLLALALPLTQAALVVFLFSLLVGLEGQTWRRWYLRWRGYREVDVVLAHDADEALALTWREIGEK